METRVVQKPSKIKLLQTLGNRRQSRLGSDISNKRLHYTMLRVLRSNRFRSTVLGKYTSDTLLISYLSN